MPILFLIRHGETDYTGKRLVGRWPGVHLVARGEEQAGWVAQSLNDQPIRAIYSSPLERAKETAQPLAAMRKMKIIPIDGLKEVDFGEWTGKSLRWLRKLPEWKDLHENPKFRFPGGESLPEVRKRVASTLEELASRHGKKDRVVIFTHGDVVRFAVEYFLSLSPGGFHRLMVNTASLTVIRIQDGKIMLHGFNLQPPYVLPEL